MSKAYSVIGRSPNSFFRNSQGTTKIIIYDCGHKHRTLMGALSCLRSIARDTRSTGASIEVWAKDQQFEGKRVADDDIYAVEDDATLRMRY